MSTQPVEPVRSEPTTEGVEPPVGNSAASTFEQVAEEIETRQARKREYQEWRRGREYEIAYITSSLNTLPGLIPFFGEWDEKLIARLARSLWEAAEGVRRAKLAEQLTITDRDDERLKLAKALLRDLIHNGVDYAQQIAKKFSEKSQQSIPTLLGFRDVGTFLFCKHREQTTALAREQFPDFDAHGRLIVTSATPVPPSPPPAPRQLAPTDRARLRDELQRCLDFVKSPIPWRRGDPRRESDWCTEHEIPKGTSAAMGPHWADEISRLAVMMHARLGAWPAHRHCPDDESAMVWELFDRLVRRCDEQAMVGLAARRDESPPPTHIVEDTERAYGIMGDALKFTTAGFDSFKTALRNVVESILTGAEGTPTPVSKPMPQGPHDSKVADPVARIRCIESDRSVHLDGKRVVVAVEFAVFQFSKEIAGAYPNPISYEKISARAPALHGKHRTRDLKNRLPKPLNAWVKSGKHGYSLELPPEKLSTTVHTS